jgi:hypothetical protein
MTFGAIGNGAAATNRSMTSRNASSKDRVATCVWKARCRTETAALAAVAASSPPLASLFGRSREDAVADVVGNRGGVASDLVNEP